MSRYVLSAEARQDLREVIGYIALDSVDAAGRVLDEFRQAFRSLAAEPGMGHQRHDLTKRPVRFWPVYSYLIVYNPNTRPLEIVALLHGNRNVAKLLRRRTLPPIDRD
jgi:plasmid stabilization system protein ParE